MTYLDLAIWKFNAIQINYTGLQFVVSYNYKIVPDETLLYESWIALVLAAEAGEL